jgi:hypothetical protein
LRIATYLNTKTTVDLQIDESRGHNRGMHDGFGQRAVAGCSHDLDDALPVDDDRPRHQFAPNRELTANGESSSHCLLLR